MGYCEGGRNRGGNYWDDIEGMRETVAPSPGDWLCRSPGQSRVESAAGWPPSPHQRCTARTTSP